MNEISGGVGETTHWLLRTKKTKWHEEEITLVNKMQRKEWEEEWPPASQCRCHCETLGQREWKRGWVVCQAVGFYTVYSVRQTLGTSVKTFQALFLRPCVSYSSSRGSGCHRSILMPQLCRIQLHCLNIRAIAPLSTLQLLKAEIMRGSKKRKTENKPEYIFITLLTVFPLRNM